MKHLIPAMRVILGVWMVINGISHFFLPVFPMPIGTQPLAVQLMAAVVHSGLIDVIMGIQLVTGALILVGVLVPLALCVAMPLSVCAAYWAVVLEREPLGGVLALAALALNALLCLAWLDSYKGVLQRRALALGEA